MNVDSAAYRELAEKEEKLQKHILQLSEENIELKFEVEQARKDIPRFKVMNTNFTQKIFVYIEIEVHQGRKDSVRYYPNVYFYYCCCLQA